MERGNESLHKWSRSMTKKPFKTILYNQKSYDLETMQATSGTRGLQSLYKDGPVLTLTYFTARSNLPAYAFKWVNLLQSPLKRKLAAKDQIDRRFMFLKKKIPIEVVCPWPITINIYNFMTIICKHLL